MATLSEVMGAQKLESGSEPLIDKELVDEGVDLRARVTYFYNQDPQTKAHVHYETGV